MDNHQVHRPHPYRCDCLSCVNSRAGGFGAFPESLTDSFNEIFTSHSTLNDERFIHADDVEETHVRGDWERE